MDKATLTISLPRSMKDFIASKLSEGRFSTPSEYIRSLIRDDQDVTGNSELALLIRRTVLMEKMNQTNAEPVVMTGSARS
jgi:Arc/MetJ-type ribon-helix-helix transcriptional regulator